MENSFQEQMNRELNYLNIQLTEQQIQQFYQYYQMLIERNKVMNLTSITEEKQVITKHFVDSLSIVLALPKLQDGSERKFLLLMWEQEQDFLGFQFRLLFRNAGWFFWIH